MAKRHLKQKRPFRQKVVHLAKFTPEWEAALKRTMAAARFTCKPQRIRDFINRSDRD